MDDLLSEIHKRTDVKERVLVTTLTKRMAEDLTDYLADHEVRVRYLGKSGQLTEQLKRLGGLPKEQRPQAGQAINRAKQTLQQAIEAQIYRASRIRERAYEAIERGTILIDTQGARVGQINGLSVIELGEAEYMIRGTGYLRSIADIEKIPVGLTGQGTPILLRDVASVRLGPQMRRGIADLDGEGEQQRSRHQKRRELGEQSEAEQQ